MKDPRVLIIAPRGKMGKLIIKAAADREISIIGAVGAKGRDYIGKDVGEVAELGRMIGAPVVDEIETLIAECDVIIDFSTTELSMQVIEAAVHYSKPLVCGTTGFTKEQVEKIEEAACKIPLLYAANTSKAVNLMNKILVMAAKVLGEESQIDIIEMHDYLKLDAPSGTAKEMGHTIAESMGKEFDDIAVYGRSGKGVRRDGEITFHSIRSGDISSSHTVIFGMMGERFEITHHAHNWECFARGAIDCALFLIDQSAGLYSVKDVIVV